MNNKFVPLSYRDIFEELNRYDGKHILFPVSRQMLLHAHVTSGVFFCQSRSSYWLQRVSDPYFDLEKDEKFARMFTTHRRSLVQNGVRITPPFSPQISLEYKFLQLLWKKGAELLLLRLQEWEQALEETYPKRSSDPH